jgi:hypothetical protein
MTTPITSTQKKKSQNVDTGICDRFYEIYLSSGLPPKEFTTAINTASFSYILEIKNHVLEPSKKMVISLCKKFGISANWLLLGLGEKSLTGSTKTITEELSEIKSMIKNLSSELKHLKNPKK